MVVDNNPCLQGKPLENYGMEIHAPVYLKEYQPEVILIASEKYAEEIRREIKQMGLECEIITSV